MTVRTQKHAEVFRTRAVSPEVAEERGYRRYGGSLGLDPIFQADPRFATEAFTWADGSQDTFRRWVEKQTKGGQRPGWVMPKHSLPGSPFDSPLAQLRPNKPVPMPSWVHRHADEPAGTLEWHLASEKRQEEHAGYRSIGVDLDRDLHTHYDEAKYLLPPGPHGKRWDTHPRCTKDQFLAAERVFLHLEGVLKLDSLVSAGEVGADVPSVTLWNRDGALSWVDWPGGKPAWPRGMSFKDARAEYQPMLEEAMAQQADEPPPLPGRVRPRPRDRGLRPGLAAQPPGGPGGVQPAGRRPRRGA